MALRNLGCFLRLNVNIHKGFHFYNLAVMTLVRNKLTWEYSRLSSLPPLGTFCERSSLSKNVSSGVDWRKRSEAVFAGWNRLNPIYTRYFFGAARVISRILKHDLPQNIYGFRGA